MKLTPSAFLLDKKAQLKKIIEQLGRDFEYVSILGTDVVGRSYQVDTSGVVLRPSEDEERGFVVRVYQSTGFSEYSFNRIDVREVCDKMRAIACEDRMRLMRGQEAVEYPHAPKDEPWTVVHIGEVEVHPQDISPKEIIGHLTAIHDRVKAEHDKVIHLLLSYSYTQVNKLFLSTHKDLYQSYLYSNGFAMATAREEDRINDDYLSCSGLCGYELVGKMEEITQKAAERAVELLDCEKVEAGEYDIICDPDFTGLIAHEAFGHGAEMDMFVKRRAKGQEFLNRRVASDKVNMHDGAAAVAEVSSYAFDDEGNPARDTVIIQNGILQTGMCDALSALLLGVEPTGNGKRESYKRKAYTRMTNTFFEEGNDSLEKMMASIRHGYLLEGFSSGMEDPKNWGIQCVASKGREIRDGKLTGRIVSPVYLTGYVPDLLQSISMVSPGLVLSGSGYCGKGWKEWVKTSTGGSYMKARGKLS